MSNLPDRYEMTHFAFPKQQKEPLDDAAHVRSAIARFRQVQGVTDTERDQAWKRIQAAARTFDIHLNEADWRELRLSGK